jgi:hypothetical protein
LGSIKLDRVPTTKAFGENGAAGSARLGCNEGLSLQGNI